MLPLRDSPGSARRHLVVVWGGPSRSVLKKKGLSAGLCRERCLHDGVLFADRYGPCARKREKFAVKRLGEPLFLRMSEEMVLPRRRCRVKPGMTEYKNRCRYFSENQHFSRFVENQKTFHPSFFLRVHCVTFVRKTKIQL